MEEGCRGGTCRGEVSEWVGVCVCVCGGLSAGRGCGCPVIPNALAVIVCVRAVEILINYADKLASLQSECTTHIGAHISIWEPS